MRIFLVLSLNSLNVYAPADRRDRIVFFQDLHFYLTGRTLIIVAGDFNTIRDAADRVGGSGSGSGMDGSSTILNNMVNDLGLVDIGKKANLGEDRYTFYSKAGKVKSRIDFLFCSRSLKMEDFSNFFL